VRKTFVTLMVIISTCSLVAAQNDSLRTVHKVFIEKMPNDLDQYISAEITKQLSGRLVVVLNKPDADAVMRGTGTSKDGVGAAITGRYLGLHDNATGSISIVDREEKMILWSAEAGDRSLMFGVMKRGGPRKVADRLVNDLKSALKKLK
jgi:hypothetical protein